MKILVLVLMGALVASCSTVREFQGSTYKYISKRVAWSEAKVLAENEGGHLVVFETLDEQAFVESIVPSGRIAWVGATDEKVEGEWYWVNGKPVDLNMMSRLDSGQGLDLRDFGYIRLQGGIGSRSNLGILPRGWRGREKVDGFIIEYR